MYKIFEINDNVLFCNPQGFYPVSFQETPELAWESVGVFKEGGISDDHVTILKHQVQGKVIRVLNLLITCPINVLRES